MNPCESAQWMPKIRHLLTDADTDLRYFLAIQEGCGPPYFYRELEMTMADDKGLPDKP